MKHNDVCAQCISVCQNFIAQLIGCLHECENSSHQIGSCSSASNYTSELAVQLEKTIDTCENHIELCTKNTCVYACKKCIDQCKELHQLSNNIQQHCTSPNDACANFTKQAKKLTQLCIDACNECIKNSCN